MVSFQRGRCPGILFTLRLVSYLLGYVNRIKLSVDLRTMVLQNGMRYFQVIQSLHVNKAALYHPPKQRVASGPASCRRMSRCLVVSRCAIYFGVSFPCLVHAPGGLRQPIAGGMLPSLPPGYGISKHSKAQVVPFFLPSLSGVWVSPSTV